MSSLFVSRLCRVLATLVGVHLFANAIGAPGDLDPTFGQFGRAYYEVAGQTNSGTNFIRQSDGKIVVVGYTGLSPTQDFLIVRFNEDGNLDATFGSGGRVVVNMGGPSDFARSVAQQADGKLVVTGFATPTTPSTGNRMAAVRLNIDGSLDTSFGAGGIVFPIARQLDISSYVVVQTNGRIVLGGTSFSGVGGAGQDFTFVGLNPDGSRDSTFGVGGVAVVDPGNGNPTMNGMISQADGKIVAVGNAAVQPGPPMQLATRINSDGSVDTTFNGTGLLMRPCTALCVWSGITQQADGKLIFSGYRNVIGGAVPPLMREESVIDRVNIDGSPDFEFGSNGQLAGIFLNAFLLPVHMGDRASATAIDALGRIVILGTATTPGYSATGTVTSLSFGVFTTRVSDQGVIDTTFGGSGYSYVPYAKPGFAYAGFGITLRALASGDLLVLSSAVSAATPSVPSTTAVSVARLTGSGASPGIVTVEGPGIISESAGVAHLRVSRRGGFTGEISVSYSVISGSANAGEDFAPVTGTVSWADGETGGKRIAIPIIVDDVSEATNETFDVVLGAPIGGAGLGSNSATVTIARDDVVPANMLTLSEAPVTVGESQGAIELTVTRSGSGASPISIGYFSYGDSANAPADFQYRNGVLSWNAGDMSPRTITIPIINDAINEPAESFGLSILAQTPGVVLGGGATVVTISDDDPAPQIGFSVTTKTVNESDGLVTFDVTRVGATSQTVSVNYATANGTATEGSDFQAASGTLTWSPNDADTKTIVVTLLGDALHEGPVNETFSINLAGVSGGAALGANTATIAVVDDDPAPQLSFEVAKVKVNERDASATLSVTRTGASGLIHSVDFATRDGSARAGKDYVATAGTLTWLATDPDTKTITVQIIRKPRREDNENFKVDLSNASDGATIGLAECKVVITEKPRN